VLDELQVDPVDVYELLQLELVDYLEGNRLCLGYQRVLLADLGLLA
jgi:hypothetical protein